jgi:hypothetical protein
MDNMTMTKSRGLAVWAQKYQRNDLDQLTVLYVQSCLSQLMFLAAILLLVLDAVLCYICCCHCADCLCILWLCLHELHVQLF